MGGSGVMCPSCGNVEFSFSRRLWLEDWTKCPGCGAEIRRKRVYFALSTFVTGPVSIFASSIFFQNTLAFLIVAIAIGLILSTVISSVFDGLTTKA